MSRGCFEGNVVTAVRILLMIGLLANVGLLSVTHHVRNTRLRYEVGREQARIRQQILENRSLLLQVAEQRQASRLILKAEKLGIVVQPVETKSFRLAQRR
jgi:cell division protein FtsL